MLYIFFILFTIIAAIGVSNESVTLGGSEGTTLKNAPYILTFYIGRLSLFGLLIATAYFNNAALRDFQYNFSGILFSSILDKASYFFGRFFGALVLAIIPMLGVLFGFAVGTHLGIASGNISPNRMGSLYASAFVNNFFLFILPNMFIAGTIIFAVANKWKSTIVSFIATIIIIVGYLVSGVFLKDVSTESIAAMTDLLGINSYLIDTKYFTSAEKNTEIVSLSGLLLLNRAVWMIVAIGLLIISYFSFSFTAKNRKVKKARPTKQVEISQTFKLPVVNIRFDLRTVIAQFASIFKINFYTLLKSNTFKILLIVAALMLLNKLVNGLEHYGLQSYPVTHKILDFSRPISMVVGMIMLVFFSGELVWRERISHINGVIDGTPHSSRTILIAKIAALTGINIVFDLFLIVVSIFYQLANGYTHLELGVYLLDFLYSGLPLYIIWACIFSTIQILINHKYIAYFIAVILLFMIELIVVDTLGIHSYMVNIGFSPAYTYSDMNGFSVAVIAKNWFNLYWVLFGLLIITTTSVFWMRGNMKGIKNRWKAARKELTKNYLLSISIVLALYICVTGFVYYNTQIINSYDSEAKVKNIQESYEKKYKKYAGILQPKITSIEYDVSIYPKERNVLAKAKLIIQNKGDQPIDSLHYSLIHFTNFIDGQFVARKTDWKKTIAIPNAKLVLNDQELGYQIFRLNEPLQPNESIEINLETSYTSKGFENAVSNIRVVENGTFFDSTAILPAFGYEIYNEIEDTQEREERALPKHPEMKSIHDLDARSENYVTRGISDWVDISTTISTSNDQKAIAPGTLEKKWMKDGRAYFTYKNDHASLNFTNFMSARYEVARKKWKEVDIEVYYHKTHNYNIEMMLSAVEKSLAYYTENFGPYFHQQARIVEIPRYHNFAQAFPGTMPYTEGAGFITNLSNANDHNIIYSTIAHEMSHQYWAHQVIGANVEGATMLSESFAEYSALMVMKKEVKDPIKMKDLLKYDFERYLRGRSSEKGEEKPLFTVEDQSYIHYGKGSLILYALQEYIGEDKVNEALRNFLKAYAYKEAPYPTTLDFLSYLEPQVPDHLIYVLNDWFKKVTLYDYSISKAKYEVQSNGNYKIDMTVEAEKFVMNTSGEFEEVAQNDWVEIGVYTDNEEKQLVWVKPNIH